MRRAVLALPVALAAATVLTAGWSVQRASASSEPEPAAGGERSAESVLTDPHGEELGLATFTEVPGGTLVSLVATGLPPGFHGLHVHAAGLCEPDSADPADPETVGDFLSAGGHIGAGETDHGDHTGDLSSLYVTGDGAGALTTVTDRFVADDLLDEDGSALMVHAGPDNFANIPERYAPDGPDQVTLDTGDSGGRIACAVVRP